MDLVTDLFACVCALSADWPVALWRWTVHGEKASINQCDRHPLQHYSYHHDNISEYDCMHTSTVVRVILLAPLLGWSTCGWHYVVDRQLPYQKPILYFQIQTQSSWDQRNWCCAIVLPWVLQMKPHHSTSAGANNSPCQPFSASVVNIDPVSAGYYATLLCNLLQGMQLLINFFNHLLMFSNLWILTKYKKLFLNEGCI